MGGRQSAGRAGGNVPGCARRLSSGDAVAQHRKKGLRRCAGGVLDRSCEERDTELFLGDQEVQDILLAVHMASDLVLGECVIDHGWLLFVWFSCTNDAQRSCSGS